MDKQGNRTALIGIAAVLAVVAGVAWWSQRGPTSGVAGPVPAEDVGQPEVAQDAVRPTAVRSGDAYADRAAARDQRRSDQRADVAKVVKAGRDKLVGKYESEVVDPQWAGNKQQTLGSLRSNAQIEQVGAQPREFDVACRSATCRIQADFASPSAAEDWMTLYLLNIGPETSYASSNRTVLPDGSVNVEIYVQAR